MHHNLGPVVHVVFNVRVLPAPTFISGGEMCTRQVGSFAASALVGLLVAVVLWTDSRYPEVPRHVAAVAVGALVTFVAYRVLWVGAQTRQKDGP